MAKEEFIPRPPDYNVSALDKRNEIKGQIGAAWKNSDGSIRIRLNPFLVLDTRSCDLAITLFPTNQRDKAAHQKKIEATEASGGDQSPAF